MRQCESCKKTIDDKYTMCYSCFQRVRVDATTPPTKDPKRWDDDKLIDVLLKMNSNLGRIAQQLERRAKESTYDDELEEEEK